MSTSIGMFLKRVIESYLLSKYERLTPNIDQVVPVWHFRNRAQNTKISKILRRVCTLKPPRDLPYDMVAF